LFGFFETGSPYVGQAGLKLLVLLPQPPQYWDYKCEPPHLALRNFLDDGMKTTLENTLLLCTRKWETPTKYLDYTATWTVSSVKALVHFCYELN
jgi:hypothetical protein